jgi:GTP-binding protein
MQSNLAAYEKALHKFGWEEIPPYFVTSSETALGKDNVLGYIQQINQEMKMR